MPRPTSNDIELDKVARFTRCKQAIALAENTTATIVKIKEKWHHLVLG
ncbi:MAG: hypothetical protein PUP92_29480 [Rhizonema sp. PD38]|nr:hypothetical protein [Rhizonema sp. PD38]